MEVPAKKDIRKKRKNEPEGKTPVRSRPVRSEAILIKHSEEVSYAAVRKNLKSRGNPDKVEILNVDPTVEAEDIEKSVWRCLREEPSSGVEVSLTKKPFRGTRKAFVKMEGARALKLIKAAHIKIRRVACRVRRKTEVKRCYHCLGFGHMAADCRGPDRSSSCWRCGKEGHVAGSYTAKPRCYLCATR